MASLLTAQIEREHIPYTDIKKIIHLHIDSLEMELRFYNQIIGHEIKVKNLSWCFGMHISEKLSDTMRALNLLDRYYYGALNIPDMFLHVREHIRKYLGELVNELRQAIMERAIGSSKTQVVHMSDERLWSLTRSILQPER